MPYETRKVKGGVKVVNKATGKVHAKASTPENAAAQVRLLQGAEHGWKPTGAKATVHTAKPEKPSLTPREKISRGLAEDRKKEAGGKKHVARRSHR